MTIETVNENNHLRNMIPRGISSVHHTREISRVRIDAQTYTPVAFFKFIAIVMVSHSPSY